MKIISTTVLSLLLLLPIKALAEKFELRYSTATGATSVYVEYGEGGWQGTLPDVQACQLGALYAARGAVQGVRVWRLTGDSSKGTMTRLAGGPICRFIESGATEN